MARKRYCSKCTTFVNVKSRRYKRARYLGCRPQDFARIDRRAILNEDAEAAL